VLVFFCCRARVPFVQCRTLVPSSESLRCHTPLAYTLLTPPPIFSLAGRFVFWSFPYERPFVSSFVVYWTHSRLSFFFKSHASRSVQYKFCLQLSNRFLVYPRLRRNHHCCTLCFPSPSVFSVFVPPLEFQAWASCPCTACLPSVDSISSDRLFLFFSSFELRTPWFRLFRFVLPSYFKSLCFIYVSTACVALDSQMLFPSPLRSVIWRYSSRPLSGCR